MKRAVIVSAAVLCFGILGGSQVPRSTGAPQQNNGQNTSPADNTAQRQQTSATPPNQTIPIYAQSGSAEANRETKNSQGATDVERQLTKFTGYLVGVGLLQFFILAVQAVLFFQQKKIMEQHRTSLEQLASSAGDNARAIETQAGIMKGQLASMDGQLAAMQRQNTTLEESVTVAKDAAKSTQASVEAGIEKERARLKIVVESITPNISLARAICSLENYGLTPAFISDFRARFLYCLPKDIQPDYSMCNQILYAESLQPGARTPKSFLVSLSKNPLVEDDMMKIKKAEAFIHFYGFVNYRDVFKRDRRATIHVRWTMRWGGMTEGMIMQWWEPVGLPEENIDE
jgi:hypothetical protein